MDPTFEAFSDGNRENSDEEEDQPRGCPYGHGKHTPIPRSSSLPLVGDTVTFARDPISYIEERMATLE